MIRWCYCSVSTANALLDYSTGRWEEIKQDKTQGDRDHNAARVRRIAELGREGWELVGADGGHLYFKRPMD